MSDPLAGFIRAVTLKRHIIKPARWNQYPFTIPAIRKMETIELNPRITFFVGENGSGKSTLLEGIAAARRINPEGGSKDLKFSTRETHSSLHYWLKLTRGPLLENDAFFLRAESFYNVASKVDEIAEEDHRIHSNYGGKSLHAQSHGESFLTLMTDRLFGRGLYLFDEPEAALSPNRQLAALAIFHKLITWQSQLIVATHSPILLAYPGATIYHFSEDGIEPIDYEQTEHYLVTRRFLTDREGMLRRILEE